MLSRRAFVLKLAMLLSLAALLQTGLYPIYTAACFEASRPRRLMAFSEMMQSKIDVLCMGDSTLLFTAHADVDKRSLLSMFQLELKEWAVEGLTCPAYTLKEYALYSRHLTRQPNSPRLVVCPINLRTFSSSWDLRPDWQFRRERIYLEYDSLPVRIFYKPLTIFKAGIFNLTPVSQSDFLESPVYDGEEKVGIARDYYVDPLHPPENADPAKSFIWYYMGRVDETHRTARAMVAMVRALRDAGIDWVLYITPLDHEAGDRYVGERFQEQVRANVSTLRQMLLKEGTDVHDFSFAFGSAAFEYPPCSPDEHLKERARRALAHTLADIVRARLRLPRG